MVARDFVILNPSGFHLRPAGLFSSEMQKFSSSICLEARGEVTVNAKSIMGILSAFIKKGDTVTVICEGADEEMALARSAELIESGFEE